MPNHHTSKNSCYVTFKLEGQQFKMMDHVHKEFGVNKTKQMEYLFSHFLNYLAPENSDKNYSEEYIELMSDMIEKELANKLADFQKRKPFKGTASEVKKELLKHC